MITDGLQNTIIKNMAEYGCYFICLCRICELETNNDVDLIMAAQYALAKGYIKKDFTVIDPANFLLDMLDKKVEVTLYNFRMEPIHKELYPHAAPTIVFKIDRELSNLLPKGIYHCSVTVFNDEVCYTIFDTNDCDLLVK